MDSSPKIWIVTYYGPYDRIDGPARYVRMLAFDELDAIKRLKALYPNSERVQARREKQ